MDPWGYLKGRSRVDAPPRTPAEPPFPAPPFIVDPPEPPNWWRRRSALVRVPLALAGTGLAAAAVAGFVALAASLPQNAPWAWPLIAIAVIIALAVSMTFVAALLALSVFLRDAYGPAVAFFGVGLILVMVGLVAGWITGKPVPELQTTWW